MSVAHIGTQSAVIVTGAGGGIGAATAHRLAADGHTVMCMDCDQQRVEAVVASISATGGNAVACAGDVTRQQDCARTVERAIELGPPLCGLVNNAAVGAFDMSVESTSLDEWNRILAINLTSVYLMSREVIPHIRAGGGGVIVNISSIHAFATSTSVAPYAAAKGGVLALTRTMALDLADDHIRVVCVVPGAVDTPMLHSHAAREGKSLEQLGFPSSDTAIGRVGSPSELAGVISFLLSRDATFITGSALVADGGILARF